MQFSSASAFKASLEARLRMLAESKSIPFSTVQLKFVIERLLARLFHEESPAWILKGGFAMDLRFRPRARTTKDVDLAVALVTNSSSLREALQRAVEVDLGDFLSFRIGLPTKEIANAPHGGSRYPCEAILLGKTYAKFHLDIGVGDPTIVAPDVLEGEDFLGFMGIAPAKVFVLSKEQQFAEKLHTYSYPWGDRENSRTRDLVDLVLIIERGQPDVGKIRAALAVTFDVRATHSIPVELNPPPSSWSNDFGGMAREAGLTTESHTEAFEKLRGYWRDHRFVERE